MGDDLLAPGHGPEVVIARTHCARAGSGFCHVVRSFH